MQRVEYLAFDDALRTLAKTGENAKNPAKTFVSAVSTEMGVLYHTNRSRLLCGTPNRYPLISPLLSSTSRSHS